MGIRTVADLCDNPEITLNVSKEQFLAILNAVANVNASKIDDADPSKEIEEITEEAPEE